MNGFTYTQSNPGLEGLNIQALTGSSLPTGEVPSFLPISEKTPTDAPGDDLAPAFTSNTAPSADLDKPIVDAWNEHQRLVPLCDAAFETEAELWTKRDKILPPRPDELKVRETDFPKDSARFVTVYVGEQAYYDERIVAFLRKHPRCRYETDDEATAIMRRDDPQRANDHVIKRVPNAEDQARADEILAAWDRWQVDLERLTDEIGITTAADQHERLMEALRRTGETIRDIPAFSLKGIGLKASWALQDTADNDASTEVLRQVEEFARRHNYMSQWPADQIAELEHKMALPAADWELFRLFNRWIESAVELEALDEEMVALSGQVEQERQLDVRMDEVAVRAKAFVRDIARTPAASQEGVRLKAHIYAHCFNDSEGPSDMQQQLASLLKKGTNDELMSFSIARDLARLAPARCLFNLADRLSDEQAAPDRRALEAYRTWLSNEYRSLTGEMYPGRSEMLGTIAVNNAGDKFHFRDKPPASTRAERVLGMFGLDWTRDEAADVIGDRQVAA